MSPLGGIPGLLSRRPRDDVQPDAELQLPAVLGGACPDPVELLLHLFRWLAPGEVDVRTCRGELYAFRRRTAEEYRGLHLRTTVQRSPLDLHVFTVEVQRVR